MWGLTPSTFVIHCPLLAPRSSGAPVEVSTNFCDIMWPFKCSPTTENGGRSILTIVALIFYRKIWWPTVKWPWWPVFGDMRRVAHLSRLLWILCSARFRWHLQLSVSSLGGVRAAGSSHMVTLMAFRSHSPHTGTRSCGGRDAGPAHTGHQPTNTASLDNK